MKKTENKKRLKYTNLVIATLAAALMLLSCEDAIDVKPTDQLTDVDVWRTPENADLFLNDIYNSLNPGPWPDLWTNVPTGIGNDPLDNYSDNSLSGNIAGIPSYQLFANGTYGPSNPIFGPHWENMYKNIRKCNLFLEKLAGTDFDEETKAGMTAQARFLRAYYYKSLIDLYGGVPLITAVLDRNKDEEISFPRNTYEECVAFIREECAAVAEQLPETVPPEELGRVTRGAALALKGELELYAGMFEEAAATNWEVMESGVYDLFPDYGALFYPENENNQEVIFDVQYAPNIKGHSRDTYWSPPLVADGFGWGAVNPTQDLVDCYEFLDGKTAEEGSIRYDPAHPYEHRDNRFYATIIYDGSEWRGGIIYTRLGIPNNRNEIDPSGSGGKGRTGYFLRKMLDPSVIPGRDNLNNKTGGSNSIIFRYAEILLNYAEAKNEVSGPDVSVYDAVNKVRERAGLPDLPQGLDQATMRERIRRERRVELAFEGKRLYDLWRWRIAEDVFNKPLHGMKITEENGVLNYERIEAGGSTVKFDPTKNYRMPIPQDVIDQNQELEQNDAY